MRSELFEINPEKRYIPSVWPIIQFDQQSLVKACIR